jgi:hypothetical protein
LRILTCDGYYSTQDSMLVGAIPKIACCFMLFNQDRMWVDVVQVVNHYLLSFVSGKLVVFLYCRHCVQIGRREGGMIGRGAKPTKPLTIHPPSPQKSNNKYFLPVLWIRIHRIHMFLGLPDPDPDPLIRGMDSDPDPDPSIIMQK